MSEVDIRTNCRFRTSLRLFNFLISCFKEVLKYFLGCFSQRYTVGGRKSENRNPYPVFRIEFTVNSANKLVQLRMIFN